VNDRRSEDRVYTAVVMGFLVGLVALGLLGVPALLVAAIGILVAAIGIAVCHRFLEERNAGVRRRRGDVRVPEKYVPTVLEGSSMRRRRIGHLRRNRHASPPLRFH
jgi:hypothetical protein